MGTNGYEECTIGHRIFSISYFRRTAHPDLYTLSELLPSVEDACGHGKAADIIDTVRKFTQCANNRIFLIEKIASSHSVPAQAATPARRDRHSRLPYTKKEGHHVSPSLPTSLKGSRIAFFGTASRHMMSQTTYWNVRSPNTVQRRRFHPRTGYSFWRTLSKRFGIPRFEQDVYNNLP